MEGVEHLPPVESEPDSDGEIADSDCGEAEPAAAAPAGAAAAAACASATDGEAALESSGGVSRVVLALPTPSRAGARALHAADAATPPQVAEQHESGLPAATAPPAEAQAAPPAVAAPRGPDDEGGEEIEASCVSEEAEDRRQQTAASQEISEPPPSPSPQRSKISKAEKGKSKRKRAAPAAAASRSSSSGSISSTRSSAENGRGRARKAQRCSLPKAAPDSEDIERAGRRGSRTERRGAGTKGRASCGSRRARRRGAAAKRKRTGRESSTETACRRDRRQRSSRGVGKGRLVARRQREEEAASEAEPVPLQRVVRRVRVRKTRRLVQEPAYNEPGRPEAKRFCSGFRKSCSHGQAEQAQKVSRRDAPERYSVGQVEVFCGNLRPDTRPETLQAAFRELFRQLPDFVERYGRDFEPFSTSSQWLRRTRCRPDEETRGYLFPRFVDPVLTNTALEMSGFLVDGRSCVVKRSSNFPADGLEMPAPLDVSALRRAGKLPHFGGPGAEMQLRVWVGSLTPCLSANNGSLLKTQLTEALRCLPSVNEAYPAAEAQPLVLSLHCSNSWGFVDMATEVLAATVAAMKEVRLPSGDRINTGWPSRCIASQRPEGRVPPLSLSTAEGPAAGGPPPANNGVPQQATPAPPMSSQTQQQREQESECDVWFTCDRAIDEDVMKRAVSEHLLAHPTYKETFPDLDAPIIFVKQTPLTWGFIGCANATLASTLVVWRHCMVNGHRIMLCRPRRYKTPSKGPQLPLPGTVANKLEPLSGGPPDPEQPCFSDVATLWVGNLPTFVPEAGRRLEKFVTKFVCKAFDFDVEAGPPITKVFLHKTQRYAFITIRVLW
eukprot:TRINITY_DN36221_c0_g1_i3.p1 TRINITY_DN36221_c0_g1~~TRINITY_DN36221_c0_g1_i3.p1  ORF type:complete len:838 (+),score=171.18 TRINITY_DN36221_c0_g1_i3:106-2619(+)